MATAYPGVSTFDSGRFTTPGAANAAPSAPGGTRREAVRGESSVPVMHRATEHTSRRPAAPTVPTVPRSCATPACDSVEYSAKAPSMPRAHARITAVRSSSAKAHASQTLTGAPTNLVSESPAKPASRRSTQSAGSCGITAKTTSAPAANSAKPSAEHAPRNRRTSMRRRRTIRHATANRTTYMSSEQMRMDRTGLSSPLASSTSLSPSQMPPNMHDNPTAEHENATLCPRRAASSAISALPRLRAPRARIDRSTASVPLP